MPEGWGDKMLPFLAVGRVKDNVTLAFYIATDTEEQREQTKDVFRKLLAAASSKLQAGQRTRLQWNDGSVCCLMDQQGALLYCVVTSLLTYPERLAYQLLYDLVVAVQQLSGLETAAEHALNDQLQPRMRELILQYEDPKNFPQMQMALGAGGRESGLGPMTQDAVQANANARNRKYLVYCLLSLVILAVIIVVIVASVSGGGGGNNDATPAPEEPNPQPASLRKSLANAAFVV